MTMYLIAPPGTRTGEPGWHKPPGGLRLRWDHLGGTPPVAVLRNGILVSTGIQTGYTVEEHRERDRVLYGSCEECGIPRVALEIEISPGDVVLTLSCPAGCDLEQAP